MHPRLIDASRGAATAGVLLSAAVHLNLWDVDRFRAVPTIGPLFLLNAVGGLVLGLVLIAWRHWLPALAAAGYGAITVLFFWISVIHGLFGFKEVATGSAQILAEVAEYAAVIFGLLTAAALWTGIPWRGRRRLVRPGTTAGQDRLIGEGPDAAAVRYRHRARFNGSRRGTAR